MKRIEYITAGESHGPALTAILKGIPAGYRVNPEKIAAQMKRRQSGYGRGGRMKIEKDRVEFLSGMRGGHSLGGPITLQIVNRDFDNWQNIMHPTAENRSENISLPRPGHADYAGMIKYHQRDLRNILERASARETAIRTAVGALCRQILEDIGIQLHSRVLQIGNVKTEMNIPAADEFEAKRENDLNVLSDSDAAAMKDEIQRGMKSGDSIGGIFQVLVYDLPIGLGSHVQWSERISSLIARHIMGINAIKGIEFGAGFRAAVMPGSQFHDEFDLRDDKIIRRSNNAGGQEGGISNGEVFYFQAVMKPIPTLAKQLQSVDMGSGELKKAHKERTDSCAVPAASIIAENVTAIPILDMLLEKYGGDSREEFRRHFYSKGNN